QSMNSGRFRSDLFFRIAQVRIEIPPLRDRREDIALLVRAVCKRIGRPERGEEVVDLVTSTLAQHEWPGNVSGLVDVASVAAPPVRAPVLDAASATAGVGAPEPPPPLPAGGLQGADVAAPS